MSDDLVQDVVSLFYHNEYGTQAMEILQPVIDEYLDGSLCEEDHTDILERQLLMQALRQRVAEKKKCCVPSERPGVVIIEQCLELALRDHTHTLRGM